MRDGLIGDVYMARGLCFKWRDTIGHTPVEPVPAGVDYDLWTGPAPMHQFTTNRFHYNWHWFWDTGNGDLGNQGIHEMDMARWGLGVKYPGEGQRHRRPLHVRRRPGDAQHAELRLRVRRERQAQDDGVRSPPLDVERRSHRARIAATTPSATCSTARRAIMAVDSYSSYKTLAGHGADRRDRRRNAGRRSLPELHRGGAQPQARDAATPRSRKARPRPCWCTWPTFLIAWAAPCTSTPSTMTCTGDAEANKLLTRNYRKPFVVPEKV